MQQEINGLLNKIATISNRAAYSSLEKDLMLQYTRELYDCILSLEVIPAASPASAIVTEPANDFALAASSEPMPGSPNELPAGEPQADQAEERILFLREEEKELMSEEEEVPEEADELYRTEEMPKEEEDEEEEAESPEAYPEAAESVVGLVLEEGDEENDDDTFEDETAAEETLILTVNEQPFQEPEGFELEPELRREQASGRDTLMDFRLWSRDVRSYIGINDKYNFISELFLGNAEAYEEILNEINRLESAEEARYFLEQSGVTTLYKWKEDGFSEQIFYNVLNQFFSAR